jgi:hypothetical protein
MPLPEQGRGMPRPYACSTFALRLVSASSASLRLFFIYVIPFHTWDTLDNNTMKVSEFDSITVTEELPPVLPVGEPIEIEAGHCHTFV